MIYVLDTNVFIVLTHFYPSAFPSLWAKLDDLAEAGTIVSVSEVYNELKPPQRRKQQKSTDSNFVEEKHIDSDFVEEWVKRNKHLFAKPSNAELLVVQQILAVPHFQAMISTKALLRGTPVADPFVVAAAKAKGGTVITQEKHKPNAAKIPNVCKRFNVPCMDLQAFMTQQGWTF